MFIFSALGGIGSFIGAHWLLCLIIVALIVVLLIVFGTKLFANFTVIGKISSTVMGLFKGGSSSITLYALGGLALSGFVAYHYYEISQYQTRINTLTTENATLTANVTALNLSNTGLTQELAAEKTADAQLQKQITDINNVDDANNNQLNNVITTALNTDNENAALIARNSPTAQQAFIKTANDNLACYFSTFANGLTGTCKNGVFVAYASPAASGSN